MGEVPFLSPPFSERQGRVFVSVDRAILKFTICIEALPDPSFKGGDKN
jgi:hypothetical protein